MPRALAAPARRQRSFFEELAFAWAWHAGQGNGAHADNERMSALRLMFEAAFHGGAPPPADRDVALALGTLIALLEQNDVCLLNDFEPPWDVSCAHSCSEAFKLWCEIAEESHLPPDMLRHPEYRDASGAFIHGDSSDDDADGDDDSDSDGDSPVQPGDVDIYDRVDSDDSDPHPPASAQAGDDDDFILPSDDGD